MFVCDNCGRCCTDKAAQIALTVGDLIRISEHLNASISSLFGKYIDFNPFRCDAPALYDYEIGLNIPCGFRQKERCIIYESRDLNSRLFPFWMINVQEDIIDPNFGCLSRIKELKNNKIYLKYKKVVAEILLSESELTDTIIDKIGARKQIDLRDYDEFYLLIDNYKDEHEFEERKIELAIKLRDNNFFNNFPKLIEAEIADNLKLIEQIKINNAKLKEAESIVKNGN